MHPNYRNVLKLIEETKEKIREKQRQEGLAQKEALTKDRKAKRQREIQAQKETERKAREAEEAGVSFRPRTILPDQRRPARVVSSHDR